MSTLSMLSSACDWHAIVEAGGKLVVGNWKMNGTRAMLPRVIEISDAGRLCANVGVGLALPYTLIASACVVAPDLAIGSQDIHVKPSGAHTAGVSAEMVQDAGACFTILNHSELRRGPDGHFSAIQDKIARAVEHSLAVVLCCGETFEERREGSAERSVCSRLESLLRAIPAGVKLVFAYEPYWAIGSGQRPTVEQITTMHNAIRLTVIEQYGASVVPVLYGGSVDIKSAGRIAEAAGTDGVLVGSASLTCESFTAVIRAFQT